MSEKRKIEPGEPWGVFDTVKKRWLGTSKEPHAYTTGKIGKCVMSGREKAQCATAILTEQLGYAPGRLVPQVLPPGALIKRDTVTARIDGEEAVRRIEARKARPTL